MKVAGTADMNQQKARMAAGSMSQDDVTADEEYIGASEESRK
jgi:hypothetical protein